MPLIHWIEDCSSAKDRLHLIQAMVLLYGWSIMEESREAILL